jgi:hypothetical protein
VAGEIVVRVERRCRSAAQALDIPFRQQESWDKGKSPLCKKYVGSESSGVYFNSDGVMPDDQLVCERAFRVAVWGPQGTIS